MKEKKTVPEKKEFLKKKISDKELKKVSGGVYKTPMTPTGPSKGGMQNL